MGMRPYESSSSTPEPAAVFAVGLCCFIAWTFYAGPDVGWDFLNYHLYVGLNAGGGALSRDYFPADSQSYFTPYAYWPIAAMIAAKWPAPLVGSAMAAIHSVAVLAVWYLSKQFFPDESRTSIVLRATATFLGIVAPVALTQIGTSYIDLTTAIFGVLGVALLIKGASRSDARPMVLIGAGLCFGIATALKFTHAAFAVAAVLVMVVLFVSRSSVGWKNLLVFGAAGVAGFLVAYGVWGYQLWREFGNPLFPFLESFFHPSAPTVVSDESRSWQLWDFMDVLTNLRSGLHHRYLPLTLDEWLLRPLYMIDPVFNVYVESRAPDGRFLALFCLLPLALWKVRKDFLKSPLGIGLLYFLVAWIIWMAVSGNGRYMMILVLAAGPLLVACAKVVWPGRSLVAVAAITVFACVQFVLVAFGSDSRISGTDWHAKWVSDAGLPPEVTRSPATFVGFIQPSISWFSAFVHPQSRFMPLPAHSSGPATDRDRVARTLKNADVVYAVFDFRMINKATGHPLPSAPTGGRADAERNGLRIDFTNCLTGRLYETAMAASTAHIINLPNGERIDGQAVRGFFFCRATFDRGLIRSVPADPSYESLFERIETACPSMYFPKGKASSCTDGACTRAYHGTDSFITIDGEGHVRSRRFGGLESVYWGTVQQLLESRSKINCHQSIGKYAPWSPGKNLLPNQTK